MEAPQPPGSGARRNIGYTRAATATIMGATQPRSARWKWACTAPRSPPGKTCAPWVIASVTPNATVSVSPPSASATPRTVKDQRERPRRLKATLITWARIPTPTSAAAHARPSQLPIQKWPTIPRIPAASPGSCHSARRSLNSGRSITTGII